MHGGQIQMKLLLHLNGRFPVENAWDMIWLIWIKLGMSKIVVEAEHFNKGFVNGKKVEFQHCLIHLHFK